MKLYEHKEEAPLSFYKFFMYVFLPLGTVSCIYSIISYIFMRNLYSVFAAWYIVTMIILGILLLILYGFMFVGMLKWKKYTFALFGALLALCVISSGLSIVNMATSPMNLVKYTGMPDFKIPDDLSIFIDSFNRVMVIVVSVVNVGLYILMYVYFYKRRLLFDGVPYKIPGKNAQYYQPQQLYPPQQAYPLTQYPPQYCMNCGAARPSPEFSFCPECGKKYPD